MKRTRQSSTTSKSKKVRKTHEVKQEENKTEKIFDNSDSFSVTTYNREDEDFPRGGKDVLTPLERRSLQYQAEEDVLFGKNTPVDDDDSDDDEGLLKGKKKNKVKPTSKDSLNEGKKKQHHLPYLSSKNLTEGTLLLGAVREIRKYNLIVSLPNNMTGSVGIGNVSDPIAKIAEGCLTSSEDELMMDSTDDNGVVGSVPDMTTIFYLGQLVICCVLSVQKNHIELSVNPRIVNSNITGKTITPNMMVCGCITSNEDHGYLIDFGVTGKNGFLLKKNTIDYIKQHCGDANSLFVGQVVNCLVVTGASARAVPVTINPQKITSSLLSAEAFLPLSSLVPGILVNGIVKECFESGLLLNFLGGFEGSVSSNHLSVGKFDTKLFPIGKKVKCRLLWIDVLNKKIGLSLQQHIVSANVCQFSDIDIGDIFHTAKIVSVNPHGGIILDLDNGTYGYCPLRLLYDEKVDKVQKIHSVGSLHSCRVVQFNLIDGVAVVGLKESIMEKSFMKLSDIKPGMLLEGQVDKLTEKGIRIKLSDYFDGFCPNSELTDTSLKVMRKKLTEGSLIKCRVLIVDVDRRFVLLTCRKSLVKSTLPPLISFDGIQPGDIYDGMIVAVIPSGLVIKFYNKVKGFAPMRELNLTSAQAQADIKLAYKTGQVVTCRVIDSSSEDKTLILSLKLNPESSSQHESREVTVKKKFTSSLVKSTLPSLISFDGIQPGDIYDGMIVAVIPSGLVIKFSDLVKGFAPKRELNLTSAQAQADVKLAYKTGQVVTCRVINSSSEDKTLILSLKLNPESSSQHESGEVALSKVVQPRSKSKENENGGSSQNSVAKIKQKKSQKVTSKLQDVSSVKENVTETDYDESVPKNNRDKKRNDIDNSTVTSKKSKLTNNGVCGTDNGRKRKESSNDAGSTVPSKKPKLINDMTPLPPVSSVKEKVTKKKPKLSNGDDVPPPLPVSGGFEWEENDILENKGEDIIESVEDDKASNKKTRRQKKAAKNAEEAFLYEKEFQLMESASKPPVNADDFDRQLAINPNSSNLWLQYMAYYLHLADVEKARATANKALSTISFREEQEKLNVWYGLLNLENLYGTQETLMKTFQDALKNSEPLPLYYKLAGMYQLTDKVDLAEQVFQTMTKKFSNDTQVWIKYGLFLMQNKRIEAARNLMKRSFNNLTKQQQVTIISKFAQYEFKFGDSERGHTMFENLVSSYPKRVDLWSVYVDMMAKNGNINTIRDIFERAVNLKISVKKAKFLFKKYLAFEESHGTPATVNSVKDKAKAFVMTKTNEQESNNV